MRGGRWLAGPAPGADGPAVDVGRLGRSVRPLTPAGDPAQQPAGAVASPGRRALLLPLLLVALVYAAAAGWRALDEGRAARQVVALARPGDIVMLSSLTCAYCSAARRWFSEHRVPFDECFIERDAACAARYQATLAAGTPTLLVRGRRQLGFDVDAVAQALANDGRRGR